MLRAMAEKAYKLENYRQKIAGLQVAVTRALDDVQSYTQRLEVAKIVEAKRRELERLQVGSQLNTFSALDSRLEINRGLETARAAIQSATADLEAMIQERDGYLADAPIRSVAAADGAEPQADGCQGTARQGRAAHEARRC